MTHVTIRIVGRDLPGTRCGEHDHVHVGIQIGREPAGLTPADAKQVVFETPVDAIVAADGTPDFRGPGVHGKRGARFRCHHRHPRRAAAYQRPVLTGER